MINFQSNFKNPLPTSYSPLSCPNAHLAYLHSGHLMLLSKIWVKTLSFYDGFSWSLIEHLRTSSGAPLSYQLSVGKLSVISG